MSTHTARRAGALALAALSTFALGPARARAAEEPARQPFIAWSGEIDINSHYVWRGIAFSQGAVFNPSLTASHGKWSFNAWGNLDRDLSHQNALNELDLTLGWSTSLLGIDIAPSVLFYGFPIDGTANTAEVQVQVSRPLHGPFSVFTRQSVEFVEVRGAAWSAAGLACELPGWNHVAVSGNVQYGRGWWKFASVYADPGLEGLNVTSMGISAVVTPPGTGFTLRPHVDWCGVGNALVKDHLTGATPWVVGIALGGSF